MKTRSSDAFSEGRTRNFEESARESLADSQLRRNLGKATQTIRRKRTVAVEEMPDWEQLREAGRTLKSRVVRHLDEYLLQLEESVTRAGGQVHWARDAEEANRIIAGIAKSHDAKEVVKVKSIATDETKLNEHLESEGIEAFETDLAELIIQLAGETSSHILVPAIHKNRAEIRELFMQKLGVEDLPDDPPALTNAARLYLREKFLNAKVGISGANFAVAETGTVCVVESEGNGRMCTTLPPVLVTLMGIEKIIPSWQDYEVFMQLLPRSSTAERMNPYTTFWTGVSRESGDGPQEFHLVLMDNGRTEVLADEIGRQTLACIRCSACLNVCPVYERTGGHAYNSVYPGPIGAILTPQLVGIGKPGSDSLPYASSLCGACYEVCPVKINIPEVLIHLRGKVVRHKQDEGGIKGKLDPENVAMQVMAKTFSNPKLYEGAQKAARIGQWPLARSGAIHRLPGRLAGWTDARDLKPVPEQSFREWWRSNKGPETGSKNGAGASF
ncbi:MAG TPA: LutB/LldF family L-lactate oxidation iron-sulfur protein [Rubrobacteraceae bacterium]|jgi:L-lactate dehydrogenase complex protein LldF|nr:LutB/LldF family L-lactate oxidation iron-sulfur protein [Rubrobacteraceae bacterium]HLL57876.1 LutB/LldF family L-lactate oxidation iron-sulfur protein [Rubrobacteraceae bacterium]